MDFFISLSETTVSGKLISTALLLVAVIVAYYFAAAAVRRTQWPSPEIRRRWLVMARNVAILFYLLAIVVVWAAQLRTLAISVVGFAAAIVLVTKELLMCMTGGFLRSSTSSFRVGDRIEVKGIRGDVIDLTMLTTTVLEIGPDQQSHQYTGRAVVLPNAVFLGEPLVNESYTEDYVLHTTVVPLARQTDWREAERRLLEAANTVCAEFIDTARRHIGRVAHRQGIEAPTVDPKVSLQLAKPEEINLIVRFPAPARRKGRTEQDILRRYLDAAPAPAPAPAPGGPEGSA